MLQLCIVWTSTPRSGNSWHVFYLWCLISIHKQNFCWHTHSEIHKYEVLQIFSIFNFLKIQIFLIFLDMRCYKSLIFLILFKLKDYFFLLLQSEKGVIFLNFKNVQDKYLPLKRSMQVVADEPDSSLAKCSE